LPSDLNKPIGSLVAGMPADPKALVTIIIIIIIIIIIFIFTLGSKDPEG